MMWVLVGDVQVMAGNKDVVPSSPVEKLKPFNNREVELAESWVKSRENLNLAFLKSLEADRLLHNFRVTAGLPSDAKPLEGWESPGIGLRGHFVGHWLSAAAYWLGRNDDEELSRRLKEVVDGLEEGQQKHGHQKAPCRSEALPAG